MYDTWAQAYRRGLGRRGRGRMGPRRKGWHRRLGRRRMSQLHVGKENRMMIGELRVGIGIDDHENEHDLRLPRLLGSRKRKPESPKTVY